jgi:hypothetical protein
MILLWMVLDGCCGLELMHWILKYVLDIELVNFLCSLGKTLVYSDSRPLRT